MNVPRCRSCAEELEHTFADLGVSPLANSYVSLDGLRTMEPFYPLHAYVCARCFLVQVKPMQSSAQIFSHYAYFSSFSDTWLAHCEDYVAGITTRLGLDEHTQVVEIASNDGYLLQYFKRRAIPILGIEPAQNIADTAIARGIPTRKEFFGEASAQALQAEGWAADLLIANNVIAHVPDVHDFIEGMRVLLAPSGTITIEFPHLLNMIAQTQYDTIYHEHFSYFSLLSIEPILAHHALCVYDVEHLPTHGGSLRLYVGHAGTRTAGEAIASLREQEHKAGLDRLETYVKFETAIRRNKRTFLAFLIDCAERGKSVAAYGAPAKGNTMLNYCGVRKDLLAYTVDRNPLKQGMYLPGTRIPIFAPQRLLEMKPDYVLILPWNIRTEVATQMAEVRAWGGQFVVAVPELTVLA